MAKPAPLDVHIHLQDDGHACGLACAQMVAAFLGAAVTQQSALVALLPAGSTVSGWDTTPGQLAMMITAQSRVPYKAFADKTRDLAEARMLAAFTARMPVVVLVGGSAHWVVASGFTGSLIHIENPAPPLDDVLGFDPGYKPPPPPHSAGDDCQFLNGVTPNQGADEVMDPSHWQGFFTACASPGVRSKRFVQVAPDPGALAPASPIPIVAGPPAGSAPGRGPGPGPILGVAAADTAARKGLADSGLLQLRSWAASAGLFGVGPAPAALVHRVDAPGAYYLVGLTDGHGIGALVGVDAYSGRLLFARLNPAAEFLKQLYATDAEILQWAQLRNARGAPAATVRLVWRATKTTFFSPFFPFAEVQRPNAPPIFVRLADRRRFQAIQSVIRNA